MIARSVLHIRIPFFLAAIERKRRPELAGRPVIVGRAKGNTSGVVVSVSREAAKLGVGEGMSVRQAQRTCPDAVVVMADFALYRQVDARFLDILAHYSPLLEPDSLGSAYMDVTASRALFGDTARIAAMIAREVSVDMGFGVSIGCASNKLLAKAASDRLATDRLTTDRLTTDRPGFAIPDGGASARIYNPPMCVEPGSEAAFLAPLPVKVLDVVTPKIEKRLGELSVKTIGQLAMIPERLLVRQFGPVGSAISRHSHGIDQSQVRAAYPLEVIKSEHAFDNAAREPVEVEDRLRQMANEAAIALRKRNLLVGEITLVLSGERHCVGASILNSQFQIPSGFRLKQPSDSVCSIAQALVKMLASIMQPGMEVSRVQVVLSDLAPGAASQLCLIGDGERRRRLDRAVDLVRERFGDGAVLFASSLTPAGRAVVLSRIAA